MNIAKWSTVVAFSALSALGVACTSGSTEQLGGSNEAIATKDPTPRKIIGMPCENQATQEKCETSGACNWWIRPYQVDEDDAGVSAVCVRKDCVDIESSAACNAVGDCAWTPLPQENEGTAGFCDWKQ